MTAEDFVIWLKGYLQALQSDRPEVKVIFDKVEFVTSKPKDNGPGCIVAHVPAYPLKKYHL